MASLRGPLLFLLLRLLLWDLTPALAAWQTLSGNAPVLVANGGTSGLYPDQTNESYADALQFSLPGVVLSCDLQVALSTDSRLSASGTGLCRNNLDLKNSTNVDLLLPDLNNTYVVNGVSTFGWYAIDIAYEDLAAAGVGATQSNLARPSVFDGYLAVLKPEDLPTLLNHTSSTWWLNSEYTTFTEENSNLNATLYLQRAISALAPAYVSVNEIRLLEAVQDAANASRSKVFYKFLEGATQDPSTNQTYTSLLQNLTSIAALASGILVPKSYIWPLDENNYLQAHTALVDNAHRAQLEVFAYSFANDDFPVSYNYTGDPITEILYFIESYNFSVDGFFADFPTTGSEAIACYATNSLNGSAESKQAIVRKQKVISHNGASFKYPASTSAAYEDAIQAGVDYIDCTVQISSDNIPFCRPTINLLDSTVVPNTYLQPPFLTTIPEVGGDDQGVYPFALTWDEIKSFPVKVYSPNNRMPRDPNNDGRFPIVTLADFLELAKNSSVGALITIQNAAYLEDEQGLAVVDVVADVLSRSSLNSTDQVLLQADESAALIRLRTLNVTYPRMYLVAWESWQSAVSLDETDFVEISKFATSISIFEKLVQAEDSNYFLKGPPPTNLIKMASDQNLSTYYQYHRNEFLSYAFDLRADPTTQLFLLADYNFDGFITDNPTTVINFLDNQCLANGVTSSTVNFTIPLVDVGLLSSETPIPPSPASAPAPDLVVPEPPLSGANVSAPAPSPTEPAAASHVSISLLLTVVMIGLQYIAIL